MFITFYGITAAFSAPARHLDPVATAAVKPLLPWQLH